MAPPPFGIWTEFYERNKEDNGAIQRLFRTNMTSMAAMTEKHLNNTVRFTETIAGSNYGNMLLVPGVTGFMQVLHHGFAHAGELGGESVILAVNGNLSEAALRTVPKDKVVEQMGSNTGRRSFSIECPSLESLIGVDTAEEFSELEAEGNVILKNKPNHVFIGPDTFFFTKGAKTTRAGTLAMHIADRFREDPDDDDQVNTARLAEAKEAELLLAILWASERNLLAPVSLGDPEESAVVNQIHRVMKEKLEPAGRSTNPEAPEQTIRGRTIGFMDDAEEVNDTTRGGCDSDTGDELGREAENLLTRTSDRFRELTMTTAGIVEVMKQVEAARQDERKVDAQERSLLKHLGLSQRELFLSLSTHDLADAPELTEFMSQLAKEKTATRGLQLIQSEAKDWEGTFSPGGFHRFLSTGFVSQEINRANPGGFNLFMFHPRTVDLGGRPFDAGRARLRDLFEAEVDEETINHYSKQGLFAASNQHDMRIQLQTALDMLSLLLGTGSVATQGLAYVLEPGRWRRMSILFHERFKTEAHFGPKFIYCLDRSLQQFFCQMESRTERASVRTHALRDKAADLLNLIDGGYDVTVRLPSALQPQASPGPPAGAAVPVPAITDGTTSGAPLKKKGKRTPSGSGTAGPAGEPGSAIVTNDTPHPAWQLPEGKRYAEFFQGRAQSTQNWPLVPDERLGARSPAPLCIRYQATAACRRSCRLAHTARASLDPAVRRLCDERFRTAYATVPVASTALVPT